MLRDLLADMLFLSRFSLKSVEVYVKGLNIPKTTECHILWYATPIGGITGRIVRLWGHLSIN